MVDVHIKGEKDDILEKDCLDFTPFNDGTLSGDRKYCNLSFQCKQIGMASDRATTVDGNTGDIIAVDYLCTGKYAKFEERSKDEEAE